jgi:predicted GIY-YIG superfamily endonuclease
LLYVGISVDPVRRLFEHSVSSHWYDQIDTVKIERHPTRAAAEAAELEAIRTEKPLHNLAGREAA